MADLKITNVDRLSETDVIVMLSDGRALTFTLAKLLTLVPDDETTEEDADKFDA